MVNIINPNNPVYFTYARNSEEKAEWKSIADVIPDLLQVFRDEGVKYSVDVEDIKNGAKISEYEREIGDAQYVIVVLSDRYFYRYHCMFELFNVLKNTEWKTIKYIKSGNFDIKNIDYRKEIKRFWNNEKFDIEDKLKHNYPITELEQAAINNNYYLDFIDSLSSLFQNVSYTNSERLKKKLFGQNFDQARFVTDIKKDLGWNPTQSNGKEFTIKINKTYFSYAFFVLGAIFSIFVVWSVVHDSPPNGNEIQPVINTSESSGEKVSFVDLGLSVLWANCNIGAQNPWDYGDYFAWGETSVKALYSWHNYIFCNEGKYSKLTKYCNSRFYGNWFYKDELEELVVEDDVACMRLNDGSRMPTEKEYQELIDKCKWELVTDHGFYGYKITGENGKSIFLPAAGMIMNSTKYGEGGMGRYWSLTLSSSPERSFCLNYEINGFREMYRHERYYGCTIRAVREKK